MKLFFSNIVTICMYIRKNCVCLIFYISISIIAFFLLFLNLIRLSDILKIIFFSGLNGNCVKQRWLQSIAKRKKETEWERRNKQERVGASSQAVSNALVVLIKDRSKLKATSMESRDQIFNHLNLKWAHYTSRLGERRRQYGILYTWETLVEGGGHQWQDWP